VRIVFILDHDVDIESSGEWSAMPTLRRSVTRAKARAAEGYWLTALFVSFLKNVQKMVVEIKVERDLISFGENESREFPQLLK
jgi:hypothetical protein